ncbi:hypothetical protein [Klenkia brasiliensis]|uniref:hypothetical protein n=1 Tax=Klenkia brasiliensis TaxID=333142 RepID=UPI001041E487|nr:hypothetical protein [Klenkia brasiliensis]
MKEQGDGGSSGLGSDVDGPPDWRQGDRLDLRQLHIHGTDGCESIDAPLGVAIISQTCDLVRDSIQTISVSPIVDLPTDVAQHAARGWRPRYVSLGVGGTEFVDLDIIATVTKSKAAAVWQAPGFDGSDLPSVRAFGQRLGRRFSRFAFPDEVTPVFDVLRKRIMKREGKERSAEWLALRDIREIRVESLNGWNAAPYDLKIILVLIEGVLPPYPEEGIDQTDLHTWLAENPDSLTIASRLYRLGSFAKLSNPDDIEINLLWMALADAWAELCTSGGAGVGGPTILEGGEVTAEVVSEDEFSLGRMRRTEMLDLDHVSGPDDL